MDLIPDAAQSLTFLLVLARIGGLVATAPIFGTRSVPKKVRFVLAGALALIVTPTQCGSVASQKLADFALLLGGELFLGVCLGLGIVILFSGVQLAGGLIGRMGGLMLADVLDPNSNENVPMFSQLMLYVTLAAFLCVGGHRIVIAALLNSYEAVPIGSVLSPESVSAVFVSLVQQSFLLGIQAAIPVVSALLLSTLVLGLIGRAVPQLNILAVGFGLNSMLSLAALSLTLGSTVWMFQDQIEPAMQAVLDALQTSQSRWISGL